MQRSLIPVFVLFSAGVGFIAVAIFLAVGSFVGGDDKRVEAPSHTPSPTADGEPSRTIDFALAYRLELKDVPADVNSIFGEEWPTALSTEPVGGEEWQQAVNTLTGKIAGIAIRLDTLTPPPGERQNHALLVESMTRTAAAMYDVSIAGRQGDVEALQKASTEIDIALEILREAGR